MKPGFVLFINNYLRLSSRTLFERNYPCNKVGCIWFGISYTLVYLQHSLKCLLLSHSTDICKQRSTRVRLIPFVHKYVDKFVVST